MTWQVTWPKSNHCLSGEVEVEAEVGASSSCTRFPSKLTRGKWRERMLKNNGDLSIALSSHQSCHKTDR